MLEKMGEFFDARLEGYEAHQLDCIASAREFYPFTAQQLPAGDGCRVLDLGCGTGLELNYYFNLAPNAEITGIDLAPKMLAALRAKFPNRKLTLIQGSYFSAELGHEIYDAAVSVESLHHFTLEEKAPLYEKICRALKKGGYFVLTDYFALSQQEEELHRSELLRLKRELGITDGDFYHYDTPLTVEHEVKALMRGGFSSVEIIGRWGATHTLKACK